MKNIIFVLDNVRSAFNVGSVFRTADGLGAGEIHLIGICPVPGVDKKLDKTSLSSLEYVKWQHFKDVGHWVKHLNSSTNNIIISIEENDTKDNISLFDLKSKINLQNYDNIYLIFGHEINGVSMFLQDKSDFILKIPMFGKKNSLNIATCVGIVGYRIKELLEN